VCAFLDGHSDSLGQEWPRRNDSAALHFRAPLVIGVLLGALCDDRQYGELQTVAFRLPLLRVGLNKSNDRF
jgi:hypothetical protein